MGLFIAACLSACASTPNDNANKGNGDSANRSASSGALRIGPQVAAAGPTIHVDAKRALGSPDAKLALVEFGDYECPYCRDFDTGTLPQIIAEYVNKGKLRYFYKDFPLSMHRQAFPAAMFARCAAEQDKFWPVHRKLYEEQQQLGEPFYVRVANDFALTSSKIAECRNNFNIQRAVQADIAEGRALNITGTPAFVLGHIDGNRVVAERIAIGAAAYGVFAREIETLEKEQ